MKRLVLLLSGLLVIAGSVMAQESKNNTADNQAGGIQASEVQSAKAEADQDSAKDADGAKSLSGISIVGNKEAPKSLYIVPWKNSEVGVKTSLTHGFLDENLKPVDKEVFMRELQFYEFSHRTR